MSGSAMGFLVWAILGAVMIAFATRALFMKSAVAFWANIEQFPVNDIKGYNRSTGILFIC